MDVHCVLRCVISRRVPCYGCALCASLCDTGQYRSLMMVLGPKHVGAFLMF